MGGERGFQRALGGGERSRKEVGMDSTETRRTGGCESRPRTKANHVQQISGARLDAADIVQIEEVVSLARVSTATLSANRLVAKSIRAAPGALDIFCSSLPVRLRLFSTSDKTWKSFVPQRIHRRVFIPSFRLVSICCAPSSVPCSRQFDSPSFCCFSRPTYCSTRCSSASPRSSRIRVAVCLTAAFFPSFYFLSPSYRSPPSSRSHVCVMQPSESIHLVATSFSKTSRLQLTCYSYRSRILLLLPFPPKTPPIFTV